MHLLVENVKLIVPQANRHRPNEQKQTKKWIDKSKLPTLCKNEKEILVKLITNRGRGKWKVYSKLCCCQSLLNVFKPNCRIDFSPSFEFGCTCLQYLISISAFTFLRSIQQSERNESVLRRRVVLMNVFFFVSFSLFSTSGGNPKMKGFALVVLLGKNVRDIVPRMTVQALLQALLIHVVSDETDATTQHKQRIDRTDVDVFLSFLACE